MPYKNRLVFENWNLGGISDSKYSGTPNSTYKLVGFDIHENPGLLTVQQAVASDVSSGTVPDDKIIAIVPTALGVNGYTNSNQTYLFQENGKVYRRNSSAAYSVKFTTSESACKDAAYFNGWVFYTTTTECGYFLSGEADVQQDSITTLQSLEPLFDKSYHPLKVINNALWLGDGNRIHKIYINEAQGTGQIASTSGATITGTGTDFVPELKEGYVIKAVNGAGDTEYRTIVSTPGTDTSATMNTGFSTDIASNTDFYILKPQITKDVLVLDSQYSIQNLSEFQGHLIIGVVIEGTSGAGSYNGFSRVIRWDTVDTIGDLVSDIEIPEFGINAMIDYNGGLLIQAGRKGALYTYDGISANLFKRIPGDWSSTNEAYTEKNAVGSDMGIPVFGLTNSSGNPAEQGVYSLGGYDAKYPEVFNLEYISGDTSGTEIGAIAHVGTTLIFSSVTGASEYIYKVDSSNKYNGAYLETQMIDAERDQLKNFRVRVCYETLPSNSTITASYIGNNGLGYTSIDMTNHTNKKFYESDTHVINYNHIMFKIATTRSTSDTSLAPVIRSVIIDFNVGENG